MSKVKLEKKKVRIDKWSKERGVRRFKKGNIFLKIYFFKTFSIHYLLPLPKYYSA